MTTELQPSAPSTMTTGLQAAATPVDSAATPLDPAALRADFPILDQEVNGHRLVYLDSAATYQMPWSPTLEAYGSGGAPQPDGASKLCLSCVTFSAITS